MPPSLRPFTIFLHFGATSTKPLVPQIVLQVLLDQTVVDGIRNLPSFRHRSYGDTLGEENVLEILHFGPDRSCIGRNNTWKRAINFNLFIMIVNSRVIISIFNRVQTVQAGVAINIEFKKMCISFIVKRGKRAGGRVSIVMN